MKLTFFKTEHSFNKWFYGKRNCDKFPFTDFNLICAEDPVEICRLTDKNITIGMVVYTKFDENMFINLFEIRDKFRGRGYGRVMFDMLMDVTEPKTVSLYFADKNAKQFWKSLGFHRKFKDQDDEREMYKKIKKK